MMTTMLVRKLALRDEDGDVTPLWEKAHLKTQEWLRLAGNKIEMQSKWFTVVQFDLNSNFKLDLNSVKRVDSYSYKLWKHLYNERAKENAEKLKYVLEYFYQLQNKFLILRKTQQLGFSTLTMSPQRKMLRSRLTV